ncbi:hypothetical protein N7474_007709 [Penicillium riverlandense]|uniref:uncharacterized protein n=1 Tax=Penicillium riverlandense TaxID=1903569 RepID=UPI0025465BBB|nr:uncharacterized protein N7474_007709 [Penicillium riverlandense]KAJ5811408.1 hypothetical protein N7474_007709 [Penicillium riverlandense]
MAQPWLDSLSDDWPSSPNSPTSPVPASQPGTPSRIPVPARRPAEQQSPADSKKKVSRPCHFVKREPPTPKSPRSPKTPKPRSPAPKSTPKSPKPTSKPTPKPTPGAAAARRQQVMDSRSPLRSVSNVSSQSGTVQIKAKTNAQEDGTPEWRRRLRGEISGADQRDLFAPMGLESVFKPPTPGSASAQQDSIPLSKQDNQLWDFTDATSRRDSVAEEGEEEKRVDNETDSPLGTVNQTLWPDKRKNRDPSGLSLGDTQLRTASGLEDLRNEGITPITFSRTNTVGGNATAEVIKSALKQVTNKLESLSMEPGSRPDSPVSDSGLFYNHSEPHPESSLREDSLLDATSHSLPQDLSMGTVDFSRRGIVNRGSFRHRFSPSPFPSNRLSPSLANSKIRSSPLFTRSQNDPPSLPRPSSSHVRPASRGTPPTRDEAMPSSGSPLKLFGEHDTFTNNRLLRRMSQFEETFDDLSDGEEPPSPSEEARRKGESRSFLSARHEPLSEITPGRNERLASRSALKAHISRFGRGELDSFDFSDNSPYETKLVYDENEGFGSRPTSRRQASGQRKYLRRGSQSEYHRLTRSSSSSFTQKPTAWARQNFLSELQHTTRAPVLNQKENMAFPETKRVPKAPGMDPTPKRRRTILRDSAEPDHAHSMGEYAAQYGDSMSLLQRSLLQHGVQFENGNYLAPPAPGQSTTRPRTPTPSQIRAGQDNNTSATRNFSEPPFDELDYSDSFSMEGEVPLVKVTAASDASRKGSITTQDYLNEATKIMDLIRAKGRHTSELTSVQESDPESEDAELSYDDESTREAFSRPPSRDGSDLRKIREPKQLNPQILSHLKKYQEKEDPGYGESVASLHIHRGQEQHRGTNSNSQNASIPQHSQEQRKRKPSGSIEDAAESIAHDLMTINTQMSGFSVRSVPTGSSQNSQAKGMLPSDLISHLIPEQVNGFTYDRLKNLWVKEDAAEQPPPESSRGDDTDDDPFRNIPDLSVDELQEMLRVHGPESPVKSKNQSPLANGNARSSMADKVVTNDSELRPQTIDGELSLNTSSVQSRFSRPTVSSVPNTGTRATSWGTDDVPKRGPSADNIRPPGKQTRTATIGFSSPLVSHVTYGDGFHASESSSGPANPTGTENTGQTDQQSSADKPFVRHPISRIEEGNEDAGAESSLIRRNDSLAVQQTPARDGVENSLVPLQSPGPDTSYSFQLTPLADFSVNQADNPLNLEMSYVAQRTNPSSLRQVHGTFALATEDLVKHITDVEPYEPYWEHVRRLVLREKGLITLHKLSDFCPRLEELDVSDNHIGQLSGVPANLRTLKIARNCLSNLTPWGHLMNLQYVDVSGNDIETLDGFSSLIHLRELKADDNRIRNIDGILDLNGLLSLKLSNNSVIEVDFEGAELTRLRDLDLSHNCLTSVHNIDWLPSLATLDLSSNRIRHLDAGPSLISLRALKLSDNRLETLDLAAFPSVNLVYLDQNCLSTVAGLEKCHNIEVLSVREQTSAADNDRSFEFDIDLGVVKDIRKVFLSSNKLSSQSLSPSCPLLRLQLLDIAACALQNLPDDFASSFPNVKVLNLNFNSVAEIESLVGMNCLSRLLVAGNRLSRMRRVCQVLSRLGRTVKGSACSLRKLDIRGNPLTVGFYPPAVTGSGSTTHTDRKRLKADAKAVIRRPHNSQDLSDALADLGHDDDQMSHPGSWELGTKPDRPVEVDDPYTVPPADPQSDQKYLSHLDRPTRLRRRVLELLLYAGTDGSLHRLDGLDLRPSLGEECLDMNQAWARLEQLGVLRRKAITN